MTTSTLITLIVAVLGSGGLATIITAFVNSKRNKAQSETEARAQYTSEFNAIVAQQNLYIERLEKRIDNLSARVGVVDTKLDKAEDYIDVLIVGITNGTIPPIPPRI